MAGLTIILVTLIVLEGVKDIVDRVYEHKEVKAEYELKSKKKPCFINLDLDKEGDSLKATIECSEEEEKSIREQLCSNCASDDKDCQSCISKCIEFKRK